MKDKNQKSILFLCTGNSCRSQIAEGFARAMFSNEWKIYSAGTMAAGVSLLAIEAMKEIGIDISGQYSKTLDAIPIDEIGYLVTLCNDARISCPVFPRAVFNEHWPIVDPITVTEGDPREVVRRTRDEIKRRMEDLLKRLEEKK